MNELTPSLPLPKTISGYTLKALIEENDLYFLYQAVDDHGTRFLIREFCPRKYAVRDAESGKLRYPDDQAVRDEVVTLKGEFDSMFGGVSQEQVAELGTVFMVQPVRPVSDSPHPSQGGKPKSGKAGLYVLLAVVACGGYFLYSGMKSSQEAVEEKAAEVSKKEEKTGETRREPSSPESAPDPAKAEAKQETPAQTADKAITPPKAETVTESPEAVSPSVKDEAVETPEAVQETEPQADSRETPSAEEPKEESLPEKAEENSSAKDAPTTPENVEAQPDSEATPKKTASSSSVPAAVAPGARAGTPAKPIVLTSAENSAIKGWLAKHGKHMPLNQWREQYEGVHQDWFGDGPDVAKNYITTLGPLGIRARQLDSSWGDNASFKNFFPKSLMDDKEELVLNVYEVTQVIAGSPADGKIKPGDVIVAMDGQALKSAMALKPKYGPYQLQANRGLDMHAGLLIDQAEGKGEITLTYIPQENLDKIPPIKSLWTNVSSKKMDDGKSRNEGMHLKIPVKGGQVVRLTVTDGGNGKGSDGFNWADLKLEPAKGGKAIELKNEAPVAYQVGYGDAKFDEKLNEWLAHAPSVLSFEIPPGDWVFTGKAAPGGAATVEAIVDLGVAKSLPKEVKPYCKNVKLTLDRIGSYADGFPKNCAKSHIVAGILAGWLVSQQNEDGSWDRPGGYTGKHFDTAWAGLALMSTGDKQYDPAIKKAAEFLAFSGSQDWWAVPASTTGIFLAEYWLKYRDNSVLPALRNLVQRLKSEVLYGDFTTGHGIHPGYRGTGVSVGGSHMTLALALAAKTPANVEDGVLDKMLDRAQEIGPSGYIPYGRTAELLSFEPDIAGGGTYSGRHGPYFIASLISNGPSLFTKNCIAKYGKAPLGGADQGHSTETLSLLWALPSFWNADPNAYYRNMEAFRWKLTLMRTFDAGICFNPNRTELMTADGVLHVYIRTAAWLLALCSDRQELVITGKPGFRSKTFREVPPIVDQESRLLSTYIRNWSLASAALGNKAPANLVKGCADLKKIPLKAGCREQLMDYVAKNAPTIAKQILGLSGVDALLKNYAAEMVLGVDVRIEFEPAQDDNKVVPGVYKLVVDVQQPMGGRTIGLKGDEANKASAMMKWNFKGEVKFEGNDQFGTLPEIKWNKDTKFGGDWNVYTSDNKQSGPMQLAAPAKMKAHINYEIDGIKFDYVRDIVVGGFEVGCAEKDRTITNDRKVWVPGILIRDHGNWGMSFSLPDGTYISAASQGNQIMINDKREKDGEAFTWVSPNDSSLMAGALCYFHTASDWRGLECRVGDVRLVSPGTPYIKNIKVKSSTDGSVKLDLINDFDSTTFEELKFPQKEKTPLELDINLPSMTAVRGVDIRITDGYGRVVIEAYVSGKWVPVYWGTMGASTDRGDQTMAQMFSSSPDIQRMLKLPGNGWIKSVRTFTPVNTNRLRVSISRDNPGGTIKLSELRVYQDVKPAGDAKGKKAALATT